MLSLRLFDTRKLENLSQYSFTLITYDGISLRYLVSSSWHCFENLTYTSPVLKKKLYVKMDLHKGFLTPKPDIASINPHIMSVNTIIWNIYFIDRFLLNFGSLQNYVSNNTTNYSYYFWFLILWNLGHHQVLQITSYKGSICKLMTLYCHLCDNIFFLQSEQEHNATISVLMKNEHLGGSNVGLILMFL